MGSVDAGSDGTKAGGGGFWGRLGRHRIDLTPLRAGRDFRLLFTSRAVVYLGTEAEEVALLVQAKSLTGSPVIVGLLGAVEVVPLVAFGLLGGHLADRLNRKRLVLLTELGLLLCAAALTVNALLPSPSLAALFVVAAFTMSVSALQRPSIEAAIPRLVPRDQLAAAAVLLSLAGSAASILGPAFGGALASGPGPAVVYGAAALAFAVSAVLLGRLRALPAPPRSAADDVGGLRGLAEGFRYAAAHHELLGSYLVDWTAMVLAYAVPLYPFLAGLLRANWAVGLLFSAEAVGGLVVSLLSGSFGRVRRFGAWIAGAAALWGAAIACLGLAPDLVVALGLLVVAGGADMVSATLRDVLWNRIIPDRLRGRMGGIEMLSYALGPSLGQVRGGALAGWLGTRRAITIGGVTAVLAVGGLCAALPRYRRFRAPD